MKSHPFPCLCGRVLCALLRAAARGLALYRPILLIYAGFPSSARSTVEHYVIVSYVIISENFPLQKNRRSAIFTSILSAQSLRGEDCRPSYVKAVCSIRKTNPQRFRNPYCVMRRLRYSCPFFALRAASHPATLTDLWLVRRLFGPDVISPRTSYGCMVPPGSEAGPASVHYRMHARPMERTRHSDRTPKAYTHKLSRSNRGPKARPYKTPHSESLIHRRIRLRELLPGMRAADAAARGIRRIHEKQP